MVVQVVATALYLSFLTDLSLVFVVLGSFSLLLSSRVLLTSTPGTSSWAWRRYQETCHYTRRAGQGRRRATTQQQDRYLSNCQKQMPWGWHEGPTSCIGTCPHNPAPCSSICIWQRMLELAGLPLVPRSLHGWEQVHSEHMWQTWKSLEMSWGRLCCLQHHPAWPVWRWVNDGTGRNILGESHRPLHALYCYIPKNGTFLVILQTNVRP